MSAASGRHPIDRNELIDLTRRALKIVTDKTTDMTPEERRQPAAVYTERERFEAERELVLNSPQLVGYRSELPNPGSFCTKTVMDVPVLLTRGSDGIVRAFQNVCAHRQAPVAQGCGEAERFVCPYHAWTYDNRGCFVGGPGREGFPTTMAGGVRLTELPAAEHSGFLWVGLRPDAGPLDIGAHLGDLGPELESWNIGNWAPIGEKTLDFPINWKLALDTFAENYHFATVHKDTFALFTRSNCALFDSYGPHHRLVFPMRHIGDIADQPEESWEPLHNFVVIYALFPNIVLSCTVANGEVFRVYPGTGPGHSVTYHQNATPMDLTDEATRKAADEIFEYAHSTVRDEDYVLASDIQRTMATGVRPELVFGRNEPGLHHRHAALDAALGTALGQPIAEPLGR
ncbi:ring-hydroxylating dioxygenase, large terminal subunit [Frankia torreyi]|uniref:Ring-hydroxylating dioxygenase, large terminal subunit n=1 Tax=Frankia torreyi TaxID=1856 RepID=A0A0D8BG70_9ACTN|nr:MULTISPECIES: SRPBCC family protein [Frankia]KJE22422.1 ring-hydroxylating dioxygenase, large terminal subunit [Frankia torreyi]KQM05026.1 ring-hydroxylating dioxygenase, large terminal subunit [Frankia sp. CpI1-P]